MERKCVLVGTIGNDCHAIGQWVVAKFLEQKGFKVIKLGICVSQQEFVDAAVETDADAVFASSLYGMGFEDSRGLRERLIEAGKGDIILYAGGLLAVGSDSVWEETERKFREIGFDRVYPRDVKLEDVVRDLNEDLERRNSVHRELNI